jgi:hypothetical protein
MGPLGWFLATLLGTAVLGAASALGDDDGDAGSTRVNPPQCGSRTAVGGIGDYCGDPL